jgi:hypothetical protein
MLQCSVAGCTRIGIMRDGASAPLCWVHQSVKPSPEDKLIAFAKFEQMYLWDDLSRAIRNASNNYWSIEGRHIVATASMLACRWADRQRQRAVDAAGE